MTLRETLEGSFNGGGFDAGEAFAQLAELYKALDLPAIPLDPATIADQVAAIGSLDASSTSGQIEATFREAAGAFDALPGSGPITASISAALATLEALGTDSATMVDSLRGAFVATSPDEPTAERAARAMGGVADLAGSPLVGLIGAATPGLVPAGTGQRLQDVLAGGAALPELLASLRALMQLAGGIDRAAELRDAVASLPSPASIDALRTELAAWDPAKTVKRITSADPVDDIVDDVAPALARVRALEQALADLVAGTAAILATFDLGRLQGTWQEVGATLERLDADAVDGLAKGLVGGLNGLITVPPGPPPATPDAFAAEVATLLDGLGAAIEAIEVDRFTGAIERGTGQVLAPLRGATDALSAVRAAVIEAEEAVATALRAIDLDEVASAIRQLTDPVTAALEEIRQLLGTLSAELGTAAGEAAHAIDDLRTGTETIATAMNAAFGAVAGALDELDLATRAEQARAALEPVATALGDVHIGEAADAASQGIDRVATVIGALPFDLLPDSARSELDTAIAPIKTFDFDTEVRARLSAQIEEIRGAIDDDVLDQIRAAQAEAASFIESIDPRPQLQAFEADTFDAAIAKIQGINPDALLAPMREALAQVPDLGALLDPADQLFDELLTRYDSFSPRALLAPLTDPLEAARASVATQLRLDAIKAELEGARAGALAAIEEVSLGRSIDALVSLVDGVLPSPGPSRGSSIGQVVVRLTSGAEVVDVRSFATAGDWIAGRAEVATATVPLAAARDALQALREAIQGLDAGPLLADIQPGYDAVAAAIEALPSGKKPLQRRLRPLLPPSPALLAVPLDQGRGDVLQSLTGALSVASQLATVDLRPIGTAVERLAGALAPLLALRDWLVAWIRRAGVVVDEADLAAAAHAALALVAGQIRTAAGARLEAKLRGTLRDATTSTIDALLAAVDGVRATLDAVSLEPLIAELEALHTDRRAELAQLRPSTQLADVVTTLRSIDHDIRTFDPFADVRPTLDALNAAADTVNTKLRPTVLLAPVMDSYDRTAGALSAIDIDHLFGPILDALAKVTTDVEDGVTDVGTAFGKLQAALP